MAPLLEVCKKLFGSSDLYEVLSVDRSANENQLKKAYHKLSLKVHPDRVTEEEKAEATQKFQTLGKIYALLSDEDRRAVYLETGEVDEENLAPDDKDWDQYWRLLFKKITVDDIKKFEDEYIGSSEEENDLKQAYVDGEGDMEFILNNVLCCTIDDEPRFRKMIKGWIKKEDVPDFPKFSGETKKKKDSRKRRAASEAEEAKELRAELGLGDNMDSLQALIMSRGKQRAEEMDSFFDSLAAKYGGGGKKKTNKKGK